MAEALNLVNPERSSIKYKVSKFPDGQQTVDIEIIKSLVGEDVQIKSRLNSFEDLELIICANQALRNLNVKSVSLYVPYFLGARSDRKFQEGGVNYLKQVICPIINGQNFDSVTVIDPHSDVLEACLNNFNKENNFNLVWFGFEGLLTDEWRKTTEDWSLNFWVNNVWVKNQNIVLVSPDAGAYKKVFDVAKKFKIERIITATKVRDLKTGQIIRTEIPTLDQHNDLKYFIVDDICDGGRTFVELAKAIKESRPTAKIYLVVTHGIFSSGYGQLGEYFEEIFTTNSVKDIGETEYHALENIPTKVKQLNVF